MADFGNEICSFLDAADNGDILIVVGENASALDIVAASYISLSLSKPTADTYCHVSTVEEDMDAYIPNGSAFYGNGTYDEFGSHGDGLSPDSGYCIPYVVDEHETLWDYDYSLDLYQEKQLDSHEVLSIDFTSRASDDAMGCNTYPHIVPRHYWGSPDCGITGGIACRTVVDTYVPIEEIWWNSYVLSYSKDLCSGSGSRMVQFPVYCDSYDISFLGTDFSLLRFGTDSDGLDYMFYGSPSLERNQISRVGACNEKSGFSFSFSTTDATCSVVDISIITPWHRKYDASVSLGEVHTNGVLCPLSSRYAISFVRDMHNGRDCESIFSIRVKDMLISPTGEIVVLYDIYSLEDYGTLKETIFSYPVCGDGGSLPFLVSGNGDTYLEWYLDVVPNDVTGMFADGVQYRDFDNDISLWQEANPSYNRSDSVCISPYVETSCPMLELWCATPVDLWASGGHVSLEVPSFDKGVFLEIDISDDNPSDMALSSSHGVIRVREALACDRECIVVSDTLYMSLQNSDFSGHDILAIGGPDSNTFVSDIAIKAGKSTHIYGQTQGICEFYSDYGATGHAVLVVDFRNNDSLLKDLVRIINSDMN